jgi:hypothetical protein
MDGRKADAKLLLDKDREVESKDSMKSSREYERGSGMTKDECEHLSIARM